MNIYGYKKKMQEIKKELKNKNKNLGVFRIRKLERRLLMYKHLLAKERIKQMQKKGK